MEMQFFVEQPNLKLKKGIIVKADTVLKYESEKVSQEICDLKLEMDMKDEGTNGINSYSSESHIVIHLNAGDILLFDETRGYYLPPYPQTTIEKAIEDISSLRGIKLAPENESEG